MDSTKGMINAEAIAAMQPGTVFLNFSRDTLVDGEAMAAALAEGRVARYITDFATPDVMKMEHALVLPHLGASTAEAEDNCAVMATNELMDYIDNGNITNSVNFPAVNAGVPAEGNGRIAVLHGNTPNMVGQITAILAKAGANIANMANASRGEAAYTLIDTDAPVDKGVQADLAAIEGVRRVRIIA
jgi:D-3-phosphoglycerate dehydrogenase